MKCSKCSGEEPKNIITGCNTPKVLQIDSKEPPVLFHRVDVPASLGDDVANPPVQGKYKNILLVYEANNHAYLYNSDGIYTFITGQKGDTGETGDIRFFPFDTVADMKLTDELYDGAFAITYGFYAKDDGGSAKYKIREITSEDVVDEMTILQISGGQLVAELVAEEANVLQFGAYGDGSHNDTTSFQACADYAKTKGFTFYVPNKTFLTDTITVDEVKMVQIEGTINLSSSSESLNIYENVNGVTPHIFVDKVTTGDIIMKGLNSASVEIQNANKLRLIADNTTNHNFIGYTNFKLGFIRYLEIEDDGSGSKWVNENYFEGGRFLGVTIGAGNSTYPHQNNIFNEPMCERTTWNFITAYGNRVQKARLEGTCEINFSADAMANTIEQDFGGTIQSYYCPHFATLLDTITVNDLSGGQNYIIANPKLIEQKIQSINVINNPNNVAVEGDKIKPGKNATIYRSKIIPLPDKQFCIYAKASNAGFGIRIRCYDEDKQLITSLPTPSLLKNSPTIAGVTQNTYGNSSYTRDNYWGIIVPNNPTVKYIDVGLTTPNTDDAVNTAFDYIDLYITSYCDIPSIVGQGLGSSAS